MKNTLLLFLLGFQFVSYSQTIPLSQIGYPLYQKKINVNRGLNVYKNDSVSFAYIAPFEYYNLGKIKDSLFLEIKKSNDSKPDYDVTCRNCNEIKFNQEIINDSVYYLFRWNEEHVRFLISYEKNPHGLITSPVNTNFTRDTTIGLIRLKNTFIHYSSLRFNNLDVNIAVMDKNFNGILDDPDLLSLSNDSYFTTVESNKSKLVKDVNLITINDQSFQVKVVDPKKFILKLIPSKQKKTSDITFHSSIQDAKINGRLVSEYLKDKPYLVIYYWGSRYKDYKKDFDDLNKLKDKAEIVCIYDAEQLPNEILGFSLDQKLVVIPMDLELKGEFDLNGYPSFLLIDKTGIVSSNEYSLDKMMELIK